MKNGHKKIGFVDWDGEVTSSRDRRIGFDAAVRESGEQMEVFRKSSSLLDIETGYQLTKRMMQESTPTAIFFGYHRLAQGGITYLQEVGKRIPDDVSVIMIGTPAWANLSATPYAVIDQNEEWVGSMAGKIMTYLVKGDHSQPILSEHRHICQCSLVEHRSILNLNDATKAARF